MRRSTSVTRTRAPQCATGSNADHAASPCASIDVDVQRLRRRRPGACCDHRGGCGRGAGTDCTHQQQAAVDRCPAQRPATLTGRIVDQPTVALVEVVGAVTELDTGGSTSGNASIHGRCGRCDASHRRGATDRVDEMLEHARRSSDISPCRHRSCGRHCRAARRAHPQASRATPSAPAVLAVWKITSSSGPSRIAARPGGRKQTGPAPRRRRHRRCRLGPATEARSASWCWPGCRR